MKFIRWKYVLPRLGLLIVVCACLRFGTDPTLKWLFVTTGESTLGAKVEIDDLDTSLREGRLTIQGLEVTNPQQTMQNLFQAEGMQLKLDPLALLQKRLVVEQGEITGIEIGADRTESGELEIVIDEVSDEPSALAGLTEKASELTDQWLEEANSRLSLDFYGQLETPKLAQQLEDKWKSQATELRGRAEKLKQRGKQLEDEFREIKANPLRGVQRLPELQKELADVQGELKSLEKKIKGLPDEAKRDRTAVLAAKERDQEFLKKQLQFDQLNGDNLTEVLLGETTAGHLQSACEWITWIRQRVPQSAEKEVRSQRSRGTNVRFGSRRPQFEVQQVSLQAFASVNGQRIPFTGMLTNVSSEPRLLADPARLTLVSTEQIPLDLELVSDHRTAEGFEELNLKCSALPMAARSVRAGGKLSLDLAPATAQLTAHLLLRANRLQGEIQFIQPDFALTANSTSKQGTALASLLQQAGREVKNIEANITIAGTLKKPTFKIDSEVGNQLADGLRTVLKQAATEKSEKLMARLTGEVDSRLTQLQSARQSLEHELAAKLGKHQQLLTELAAIGNGQAPGISVPKLSSKLNGLLKK